MNEEFPALEPRDYQRDFLADWWSQRKGFFGSRRSGKTELMISEARRFSECGFDVLFIAPSEAHIKTVKDRYRQRFGELPTFDFDTVSFVERGGLRGTKEEVIIIDEFQTLSLDVFNQEIMPMFPMFVRASVCDSNTSPYQSAKMKDSDFFDSVYEF